MARVIPHGAYAFLHPDLEPSGAIAKQEHSRRHAPTVKPGGIAGVDRIELDEEDDLMALAEAVKEDGRVTTGLVDDRSAGSGADPIDYSATFDGADPANSNHPVFRTRRVAYAKKARRAHLSVVPDANSEDSSSSAAKQDTETESD